MSTTDLDITMLRELLAASPTRSWFVHTDATAIDDCGPLDQRRRIFTLSATEDTPGWRTHGSVEGSGLTFHDAVALAASRAAIEPLLHELDLLRRFYETHDADPSDTRACEDESSARMDLEDFYKANTPDLAGDT